MTDGAIDVCFVALYTFPVFVPESDRVFGGTEVRCAALARGLARLGDRPTVVVFDDGQGCRIADGVRLVPHPGYSTRVPLSSRIEALGATRAVRNSLIARRIVGAVSRSARLLERPGIRRRQPLVDGPFEVPWDRTAIYERLKPDVFVALGVNNLSAEVIMHGRRSGTPVVLMLGSDLDLSESYVRDSVERNPYATMAHCGWYAITHASAILAQTDHQADLLERRFGRSATVLRNPIDLTGPALVPHAIEEPYVLWVGKSDRTKQPELLLEVARRLPEVPFRMILNRSNPAHHEEILEMLPPNVAVQERVPYAGIEEVFAGAAAFVNTSLFEGFPNTFLQAAKYGVPIVSYIVDPDGFVTRTGAGLVAHGNLDALTASVKHLMTNRAERVRMGRAGRNEIEQRHDLELVTGQLRAQLRAATSACGSPAFTGR